MTDQIPLKANFTSGDTTSLGEFQSGDVVPLSFGGTGATTASGARTNLGLDDVGATLNNDTTTNSSFYPTLSDSTTGNFTTATVSSSKLYFNPSSGTLNATTFNSLSDIRAKENIETLTNSLNKVIALRGVSFTLKESGDESIGVIAQEVEEIVPEVVNTGSDDYKSVSYGNLVGLLIEAVKEQQYQIDELRQQLLYK